MIYDFSFKKIDETKAFWFIEDEECNLSDDLVSENSTRPDSIRESIAYKNMNKSILVKSKIRPLDFESKCLSSTHDNNLSPCLSKSEFRLANFKHRSHHYTNGESALLAELEKITEVVRERCKTPTKTQISILLRSLAETKEEVNALWKKRHISLLRAKSLPYNKEKYLIRETVTMGDISPSDC